MIHPDVIPKPMVYTKAKRVDVNEVDVSNQFTNGQEFDVRDRMVQWIQTKAFMLGVGCCNWKVQYWFKYNSRICDTEI